LKDNSGAVGRRFTSDQAALIDLAKSAERVGGVTKNEANILRDWAKEYNVPFRGPESHPSRPFSQPHIHIGPINHVPVVD
jgi:hypothetical protein